MFTFRELELEAKRELSLRKHVYAHQISAGKLTQAKADRQMALMSAMESHFKEPADKEEAAGMFAL